MCSLKNKNNLVKMLLKGTYWGETEKMGEKPDHIQVLT